MNKLVIASRWNSFKHMSTAEQIDLNSLLKWAKVTVRQELAQAFGAVDLGDLPEVAESLEGILRSHFEHALRAHPAVLAPGCRHFAGTGHFILDSNHFDLRIGQNIFEPHVLEAALSPVERSVDSKEFISRSASLDEHGLYREIRLYTPTWSRFSLENAAVLAEAIFETGYRWLEEATKEVTRREVDSAGKDLYRIMRELLPDKALASNLWLVAFSGEKGAYLLDPEPAMHAVAAVSQATTGVDASPISLVGQFLTTVLSYPETHSRAALETGECISVSLDDSKYSDSKTIFLQAEKAIFGSPDISIFPIYKSESGGRLVAVFPTANLEPVRLFLNESREPITERFLVSKMRLKRFLDVLSNPRRSVAYGGLGKFVGGFIRGFVDS